MPSTSSFARSAIAVVAVLLATAMLLCSCALPTPHTDPTDEMTNSAFLTIDINPAVELVINPQGKVESVGAANADAEIMLWQEEDLIGADVDTAVRKITTLALEMGYLSKEQANISVTVTTDDGSTQSALSASLHQAIEETTTKAGITAKIENNIDLALSRELAQVQQKNAGKPGYDDTLTLSRYRLIQSAMRADRTLTMDAAVLMTNTDLIQTVNTAQAKAEAKFGEVCLLACEEAQFIYDNAKQTLLDSAYTMIYTARFNLSSLLGNYGASYAAYRLAYRTIEHYAETLTRLIENPLLSADDVFALAHALGIDTSLEPEYQAFRAAIADENGNITKNSVNAYLNAQYKKLDEEHRAKLETAYDEVLNLLDRLEAEAHILSEEGITTIQAALLGLNLSLSIKTYEDVFALLDALEEKINTTYHRMEEDMTENEKDEVKEQQEKMSAKIAELEKTFAQAVEAAKAEAEKRLTEAKQARES